MGEFTTIELLLPTLTNVSSGTLVAIEGLSLSGKSYLATELAKIMRGTKISSDDFRLGSDQSISYAERIDCDCLNSLVSRAITDGPVFIEGICLRYFLNRCTFSPTTFVYVKEISTSGIWHGQYHIDDYSANPSGAPTHHRWDLEYHVAEQPHMKADHVYHRQECS
jgi:hypothetical protein